MSHFSIVPNSGTEITGSMDPSTSADYILHTYNMAESDRVEARLSSGIGHRLVYKKATASLSVLVTGDSESEVDTNCRSLRLALSCLDGGRIKIRPIDANPSAKITHYKYEPTWNIEQGIIQPNTAEGGRLGRFVDIEVVIEGLATDDYDTPTSFVTGASAPVRIDPDDFVGDAIIPIITINPQHGGTDYCDKFLVFISRNTDLTYPGIWEPVAASIPEAGWIDASSSIVRAYNDSYVYSTTSSQGATSVSIPFEVDPPGGLNLLSHGIYNLVPLTKLNNANDRALCRVGVNIEGNYTIYTRWQEVPRYNQVNFSAITGFESLPIPPSSYYTPSTRNDDVQKTLLTVEFQEYVGAYSGQLQFSGIMLCRSDIWMSEIYFDEGNTGSLFTTYPSAEIVISPVNNNVTVHEGSTYINTGRSESSPRSMILHNTGDYYWIHIFAMVDYDDSILWDDGLTVDIDFVHATVFPFGEA